MACRSEPGWLAMKYGTRYCFGLPACSEALLELARRSCSKLSLAGFFIRSEDGRVGVLGGDLELAADVVGRQLAQVFRRQLGQVHADAAGDQNLADARLAAGPTHQLQQWAVIGAQQLANTRVDRRRPVVRPADRRPHGRRPRPVRPPRLRHGHQLRGGLARGGADVAGAAADAPGQAQGIVTELGVRPQPLRRLHPRGAGHALGRATPSSTTRSTASTRTTSATTSSWRATPPTTTASTGSSSPAAATATCCAATTPTPTPATAS